jgi:hypothetical protein
VRPTPPALYFFDAGMGDGTVLSRLMRHAHAVTTVPMVAVAKEISLEDAPGAREDARPLHRASATVLVITNLNYSDAPRLLLRHADGRRAQLAGSPPALLAFLRGTDREISTRWPTRGPHPSEKTGNPVYRRPSVLVVYREDHKFLLDSVIAPRSSAAAGLIGLAARRARMSAGSGLAGARAAGAITARAGCGSDPRAGPGAGVIQKLWPGENPFRWIGTHCSPREDGAGA